MVTGAQPERGLWLASIRILASGAFGFIGEPLRQRLGFEKWAVLGHFAGAKILELFQKLA
jgi:hypothetical protein